MVEELMEVKDAGDVFLVEKEHFKSDYISPERRWYRSEFSDRIAKAGLFEGTGIVTFANCSLFGTCHEDCRVIRPKKILDFEREQETYETCVKRLPLAKRYLDRVSGHDVDISITHGQMPIELGMKADDGSRIETWNDFMDKNNIGLYDHDIADWAKSVRLGGDHKGRLKGTTLTRFHVTVAALGGQIRRPNGFYEIVGMKPRNVVLRFFSTERTRGYLIKAVEEELLVGLDLKDHVLDSFYPENSFKTAKSKKSGYYLQWIITKEKV